MMAPAEETVSGSRNFQAHLKQGTLLLSYVSVSTAVASWWSHAMFFSFIWLLGVYNIYHFEQEVTSHDANKYSLRFFSLSPKFLHNLSNENPCLVWKPWKGKASGIPHQFWDTTVNRANRTTCWHLCHWVSGFSFSGTQRVQTAAWCRFRPQDSAVLA